MTLIKNNKNFALLFVILSTFLVIWLRIKYFHISFERDEGEYAYAGEAILRGELPYKDFYNMKMPVIYYTYALIFWIGGHSYKAVKVALLIYNLLSCGFLFLITNRLFNKNTALFTIGSFQLLFISFNAQGWTANSEHFVVLPCLISFYLILLGRNCSLLKAYIILLLAGFFLGVAITTKQHAIAYGILPIFYLFPSKVFQDNVKSMFIKYILQLILYGIGVFAPIFLFSIYFYYQGIFERFFFLTIQYASAYIGSDSKFLYNLNNFFPIFRETIYLWLPLIWLLIYITLNKMRLNEYKQLWLLFVVGWLVVSPGGFFRPHYFQMAFPLWAIIIGTAVNKLHYINKNWSYLPLTFILSFCIIDSGYLYRYSSEKVLNKMYRGDSFNEIYQISQKLASFMGENDKIGILGGEPQIAFYTHKKLASGYLYHYPLLENQRFATQMTHEFIQEMNNSKPKIFIYVTTVQKVDSIPNILNNLKVINLWKDEFIKNYEVMGKLYKWDIPLFKYFKSDLKWINEGRDMSSEKNVLIYIYKRK